MFSASVSLLTSAIIPLTGSLLQQVVIQFNDAVAKGEAFILDGLTDFGHELLKEEGRGKKDE